MLRAASALLCVGSLWAEAAQARTPRPPRGASAPSTAQILAPSAATVPDVLPPATAIYRCGDAYSARPCTNGATKPLAVTDTRSDAQRRQSQDVATRDMRLAAWLEAGRHERERAASEPAKARPARATTACIETAAIACVPAKAHPRHAARQASTGAAKR